MAVTRRQRYDVALNGQGLVLARSPESPLIVADQDAIFGARYAQGDRTYDDFARWWFDAQTDWAGGVKENTSFQDDASYFASSNIDAYSESGSFKLSKQYSQYGPVTWDADLYCGVSGEVGLTQNRSFVGTGDNPSGIPHVYELTGGGYNNITSGFFLTSNQNLISQLVIRNAVLWIHTVGNGTTLTVNTWNGSAFTDQGNPSIQTALGWQLSSSRCGCELGADYYVACDSLSGRYGIVSTSADNPSSSSDWTVRVNRNSRDLIVDMIGYNSQIYYMLYKGGFGCELRVFDPSTSTDSRVQLFPQGSIDSFGVGGKYLHELNGKLVITIPSNEVWELNGTSLSRIFMQTTTRTQFFANQVPLLRDGGIKHNGRIRWPNLVYDGDHFYNDNEAPTDDFNWTYPLFVDTGNTFYATSLNNRTKLYSEGSNYKSTAGHNYLLFSNFDRVSAIDKLASYVTLLFKKLDVGQKITVEYSTDQLSSTMTWTTLGTVSYQNDGAGIVQKTLYFGDAVVYKKMWIRVKLDLNDGGTSDLTKTPTVTDCVLAYLPKPDQKMRWKFTVKCVDSLLRKDQTREPKRGLDIRNFLLQSWWTKSVLLFEDFDAGAKEDLLVMLTLSTTTIQVVDSTDNFPERGYLLIDQEYILYNGKTKKSFLNCTRGARGTVKASHLAGATVRAAHRVIIDDYQEQLVLANDPITEEYLATLTIFEV